MFFDNTTTDKIRSLIDRINQWIENTYDKPLTHVSIHTEFFSVVTGDYRNLVVWVPWYLPSDCKAKLREAALKSAAMKDLSSGTEVVMCSLQGFFPEALWWFRLIPMMPEYIIKVRTSAQERNS